jgi:hypothetical protein
MYDVAASLRAGLTGAAAAVARGKARATGVSRCAKLTDAGGVHGLLTCAPIIATCELRKEGNGV